MDWINPLERGDFCYLAAGGLKSPAQNKQKVEEE
jgi:hypothetical protein